jgi:SAM-dependent methyltransferase
MCGDDTFSHKIIGQRLNQSQGLSPKSKSGITVSVKKCNSCGLIYSSPQPIPYNIQDHYGIPPDNYWQPSYFAIEENYFDRELKDVGELLGMKKGMSALDVGAGLGKCMIALEKHGYSAYGIEPSKPFYERAITKMGIKPDRLKLGAIEDVHYPEASFDFITYGAVLEHLYHPAACLEKTLKWLKPNGVIHIEVPSARWLIADFINFYYKMRGTNYVTNLSPMHVPFHLYEFDLKSFQLLGKRLGFSIVKYRFEVCQIPFIPNILQPLFRAVMKKMNKGLQLIVYLKKEGEIAS